MSPPTQPRAARRPLVALLALSAAAIGVALAASRVEIATDPQRSAIAWSAGEAWAAVMLGVCLGLLVAIVLRGWARAGAALGVLVALTVGGTGIWLALPAAGIAIPGCGPARSANATWHMSARTLVDGELREALTLDLEPAQTGGIGSLLDSLAPAAVEELGIDLVDGEVRARHCRALVSGSQVTAALPLLWDGSAAGGGRLVPRDLSIWRGDFDWWVSESGELVGVHAAVGGHPADAWPVDALRGALVVEIWRAP